MTNRSKRHADDSRTTFQNLIRDSMQTEWHGTPVNMSRGDFQAWRWWMILNQPKLYFAWSRVLARQEVEGWK